MTKRAQKRRSSKPGVILRRTEDELPRGPYHWERGAVTFQRPDDGVRMAMDAEGYFWVWDDGRRGTGLRSLTRADPPLR